MEVLPIHSSQVFIEELKHIRFTKEGWEVFFFPSPAPLTGEEGTNIKDFHAGLNVGQVGNAPLMQDLGLGKGGPSGAGGEVEAGIPSPLISICDQVIEGVDHFYRLFLVVRIRSTCTIRIRFCVPRP